MWLLLLIKKDKEHNKSKHALTNILTIESKSRRTLYTYLFVGGKNDDNAVTHSVYVVTEKNTNRQ